MTIILNKDILYKSDNLNYIAHNLKFKNHFDYYVNQYFIDEHYILQNKILYHFRYNIQLSKLDYINKYIINNNYIIMKYTNFIQKRFVQSNYFINYFINNSIIGSIGRYNNIIYKKYQYNIINKLILIELLYKTIRINYHHNKIYYKAFITIKSKFDFSFFNYKIFYI